MLIKIRATGCGIKKTKQSDTLDKMMQLRPQSFPAKDVTAGGRQNSSPGQGKGNGPEFQLSG
jgi:hypothetical protein